MEIRGWNKQQKKSQRKCILMELTSSNCLKSVQIEAEWKKSNLNHSGVHTEASTEMTLMEPLK